MKKFLVLVVVLLGAGAIFIYNNSGIMVKRLIESHGSKAAGVAVTVKSVDLDLFNGTATLYGLRVANPDGYSDRAALVVDEISVAIDPDSLRKDVRVITKIYVAQPVLNYESVGGTSNFDAIKANAESGGAPAQDSEDAGKFIVTLVQFTDGQINALGLSPTGEELNAVMPGFKIRNIGKAEGGVPASEAASRIAAAVASNVIQAILAGALFDIVGDTVETTVEGITDILPGFGSPDD